MKNPSLALAALTLLAGAAAADPAPATAPKPAPIVCPISGETISSASSAYDHETYKGKTYYFCCAGCKPIFDKNPAKAAADAAHGKYQSK